MIKAILFDKDDTLIDLAAFWRAPVLALAREAAKEDGFPCTPAWEEAVLTACGIEGDRARDGSPIVSGTDRDAASALNPLLRERGLPPIDPVRYAEILEEASRTGHVIPKFGEDFALWFSRWKAQGLLLGLVSSDREEICRYCLEQLCILQDFDVLYTDGQGYPPKPDPSMGTAFLERTSLPGGGCLCRGQCKRHALCKKCRHPRPSPSKARPGRASRRRRCRSLQLP